MTRRYALQGISFEWDPDKNASNRRRHHFETACEVFFDPFLRTADAGEESDEMRQAVLGLTIS